MSNVKAPAFITTLNGKRCTAVPKAGGSGKDNGNNNNNNNNNNGGNNNNNGQTAAQTTQQAAKQTFAATETSTTSTTSLILPPVVLSTAPPPQFTQVAFSESISIAVVPPTVQTTSSSSTSSSSSLAAAPTLPTMQIGPNPQQAQAPQGLGGDINKTNGPPVPTIGKTDPNANNAGAGSSVASQSSAAAAAAATTAAAPATTAAGGFTAETASPGVTAETASAAAAAPPAAAAASSASDSPVATGALFTTIGLSGTVAGDAAGATNAAVPPTISLVAQQGSSSGPPTVIIAGSVAGGIAVVAIAGFLFWFWRTRIMKRRRSTLLTPLSVDPRTFQNGGNGNGRGGVASEKGNYTIDRGSLGPTPRTEKMRAALGYRFKRLRNLSVGFMRGSGPSVDMNRGNSQFLEDRLPREGEQPSHVRNGSGGISMSGTNNAKTGAELTTKDRFLDWFGRLKSDAKFNWRVRNDTTGSGSGGNGSDPFAAARDLKEKNARAGSGNPDFLTLLGMNDQEVDREAQRRRLSRARSGSENSHFLGGLGLDFERGDPFSDANAIRHDSAKVMPLQLDGSNKIAPLHLRSGSGSGINPFSDANAITGPLGNKPPTNYVANVRRSRGQSASGLPQRPPSNGGVTGLGLRLGTDPAYSRESVNSIESFATRRNKFRSDPFDLDRPELLVERQKVTSSNFSTAGDSTAPRLSSNTSGSAAGGPAPPKRTHARGDSFTSKYSSGISMGDWSDPGPDVGPAATRWDSPTPTGSRDERRRTSGGSQTSVGKAL